MPESFQNFEQRKQDHIELALLTKNQASESNALDTIHLAHEALPDLDFSDIDLTAMRFNQSFQTPFLVSSMTAGHDDAERINRHLLTACATQGWAMGVGSQRRELFDKTASLSWQPLRQQFPQVPLYGNLGIAQLLTVSSEQIAQLVDALQANALIIHCNPLQEVIQPEGTPQFKGCWNALERLVKTLKLPVIVKETGCGFSQKTLIRLNDIGVAAVDMSGLGGTHWGRIEGCRASKNKIRELTAETFKTWGVNTVDSIGYANAIKPNFEIWGSGGVRHGLDAAKLLALGATTIGFAKRLLQPAIESTESVIAEMAIIEYELKAAMFCTGSRYITDLPEALCA